MTLQEFVAMGETVIRLAEFGQGPLTEPARIVIVDRLLQEFCIQMPSDLAHMKEHQRQQQDVTDAVKMAAASGQLHHAVLSREPS